MSLGTLVSIHIARSGAGAMESADHVLAVAGRGLEGDRYFARVGTYSGRGGPDREATFVEAEAIEALERDYRVKIRAGDARRNLVTRGVALNHLVGRRFRVGGAVFRGIRLCEPCSHLAELTGKDLIGGLVHRGGLRAQILESGTLRAGDVVEDLGPADLEDAAGTRGRPSPGH